MKIKWHESVTPLLVSADSVTPHPENYNNGDDELVEASIRRNGVYRPVYANRRTSRIVGGHALYAKLVELQGGDLASAQVPVAWCSLDDAGERRVVAADNEIAKHARPDDGLLFALLKRLDGDLVGTGVTDDDFVTLQRHLDHLALTDGINAGELLSDLSSGGMDLTEGQVRVSVILAADRRAEFYGLLSDLDYVVDVRDAGR